MSVDEAPRVASDTLTAELRLGRARVGWLDAVGDDLESYRLRFDPAWVESVDREVLGQIFEDHLPAPYQHNGGLPSWFSDLLPQGRLRRYLDAKHGLGEHDHFECLLTLGHDLPGAVQVLPSDDSQIPRRSRPDRVRPARPPVNSSLIPAFSLAGYQWKLSLRENERGLVVPVGGETGEWIAKLEDPQYPGLPAVEAATLAWAELAGLRCAESRLADVAEVSGLPEGVPTGDGTMLLSRRFDRTPSDPDRPRTHFEEFSQVLGRGNQLAGTAEELAVFVRALCPPEDLEALVSRLVFCVLAGNGDAHLKNWALIYPDGRNARLSPAYDLVSTVLYLPRDRLVLPIGGETRMSALGAEHFGGIARLGGVEAPVMRRMVDEAAERIRQAWPEVRTRYLPKQVTALTRHLEACRLGRR